VLGEVACSAVMATYRHHPAGPSRGAEHRDQEHEHRAAVNASPAAAVMARTVSGPWPAWEAVNAAAAPARPARVEHLESTRASSPRTAASSSVSCQV
jgi:hypothetical protein